MSASWGLPTTLYEFRWPALGLSDYEIGSNLAGPEIVQAAGLIDRIGSTF